MKKIIFLSIINMLVINTHAQNVGIGEENPQAKLHIKTTASEIMRLEGTNPYITFYNNLNYRGYMQATNNSLLIGSEGLASLQLETYSGPKLTILPDGYIGINNPAPQANMHISSPVAEVARIQGPAGYMSFYDNDAYTGYIQSSNNTMSIASAGTNKLSLVTGFIERLTVLENGNIGINNNNPSANFHVTAPIGEAMRIQAPSAYLSFYDNANYTGYLQSSGNVMSLASQGTNRLALLTNFTERITVLPNGNVGIGKSDPNFKLDVAGNVNINGVVNLNSSPGASGNMLVSKGAGVAAGWANPTNSVYSSFFDKTFMGAIFSPPINSYTDVPGVTHSFTLTDTTLVMITANIKARPGNCPFCTDTYVGGRVVIDGGDPYDPIFGTLFRNDYGSTLNHSASVKLAPGPHTIKLQAFFSDGPSLDVLTGTKMSLAFFTK